MYAVRCNVASHPHTRCSCFAAPRKLLQCHIFWSYIKWRQMITQRNDQSGTDAKLLSFYFGFFWLIK